MSCPDCSNGGYLPGEPTGTFSTQGAYFAPAPVAPGTEEPLVSKRAVLLLTDVFGLPLKNSKIVADNLAKRLNCDVWIPDYFEGRPLLPLSYFSPDRAGVKLGMWDWVKMIIKTIPRAPVFWASRPAILDVRLSKFITAIKEEKKYEKIGAVGYCYGGSAAIRLGATDQVHTLVIAHPGGFTISQVKAIKLRFHFILAAWVCAEDDMFVSDALRMQAEAVFAERKDTSQFIDYEFKVYKGTVHGFAVRPNLALPEIKEAYEKAFEQTVEWFEKTLTI